MNGLQHWARLAREHGRSWLVLWLVRALLGWTVALPSIAVVTESGLGALPQGDRALFEPGAHFLMELLRVQGQALGASLSAALFTFLRACVVLSFTTAFMFEHWQSGHSKLSTLCQRAIRRTPRFFALGAVEAVCWVMVAFIALTLSQSALAQASGLSEPKRDALALLVLALALLPAVATSVVGDAARAASGVGAPTWPRTMARALRITRAHAAHLAAGWTLATGVGILSVAVGARAAELIDVGAAGAYRVSAVLAVHQLVLLVLVVVQSLWLARVCAAELATERRMGRPAGDDTPARSDAPADPSSNPAA